MSGLAAAACESQSTGSGGKCYGSGASSRENALKFSSEACTRHGDSCSLSLTQAESQRPGSHVGMSVSEGNMALS